MRKDVGSLESDSRLIDGPFVAINRCEHMALSSTEIGIGYIGYIKILTMFCPEHIREIPLET